MSHWKRKRLCPAARFACRAICLGGFWGGLWLPLTALANAQFSLLEATRVAETLLSNQNPLVVIEEIAHDGLVITPAGLGYRVEVQGPRLPGRTAFVPALAFELTPQGGDLVAVEVTQMPASGTTADGAQLSFRPTVFRATYSRKDRGLQSLQFSVSDLRYRHPDVAFSLDRFESTLERTGRKNTLSVSARGYSADVADVMDFQESVRAFNLTLSMDASSGSGGDLLFVANRVFERLVDPGQEDTNTLGKERPLPRDLMGLDVEVSIKDLRTRWLALRDEGPRDTLSDTALGEVFVRGSVVPSDNSLADLTLNVALNDVRVQTPDSLLSGGADVLALTLTFAGVDSKALTNLFAPEVEAQTTALSRLIGSLTSLNMAGLAQNIEMRSPGQSAFLTLDRGDLHLEVAAPYVDAPNTKDLVLEVDLEALDAAYPDAVAALEPAWSTLFAPALPQEFDLRLSAQALPAELWRDLAGRILEIEAFPQDTATVAQTPALTLDGTRLISQLVQAELGGTLTLAPEASLFALGNLHLELNNLRPLIGAMQASARVPNRNLAQLLTLGSVGLATLQGFAERNEEGQQIFRFDFQQEGLPTINGRPLPVSF